VAEIALRAGGVLRGGVARARGRPARRLPASTSACRTHPRLLIVEKEPGVERLMQEYGYRYIDESGLNDVFERSGRTTHASPRQGRPLFTRGQYVQTHGLCDGYRVPVFGRRPRRSCRGAGSRYCRILRGPAPW